MRNEMEMIIDQLSDDHLAAIYEEYIATLTRGTFPLFTELLDRICSACKMENERTKCLEHEIFEMLKEEICKRYCNAVYRAQHRAFLGND